jgi:hypothetical protein
MDADAPQYELSRALLQSAREGSTTLYVTSQILCEFYSVVTNAKRVPNPRSPEAAVLAISGLLTYLHVLPTPADAVELWLDLLRRCPVKGAKIFDLQIVASMLANGVRKRADPRPATPSSQLFHRVRAGLGRHGSDETRDLDRDGRGRPSFATLTT